jgi:D-alanyl-D-alanine-carboxypeptidase/D-alanyl-D-alanine-endopeptidase
MAQAVLEGKLKVEDDIRSYLDGDYSNLAFEGQPIRLYHLLNHRSGLPFILPDPPEAAPGFDDDVPFPIRVDRIVEHSSRNDFYSALHKVVLRSAPGARFQYSNAAAQLAGYILERVYGASFEVLLRNKITAPLGMHDTRIELSSAQARRLAPGYDEHGTRFLPASTKFQGAGAIKSTLPNMLAYATWQLDASAPAVALSHAATYTDGNFSIGLNWQIQRVGGRRVIWQDGATPGFASFCILQPEADLALVILSNELDATTLGRLSTMANTLMQAIDVRSVTKP